MSTGEDTLDSKENDTDEYNGSQLRGYIDVISALIRQEDNITDEVDEQNLQIITRSSSKSVAEEAHEKILDREDVYEEEIPYEDPRQVLRAFERKAAYLRDEIVDRLEKYERKEKESADGSDINTLAYIVDKKAGKSGNYTIIGGAESVIYNIGHELNWNDIEIDLILEANRIASQRNNLEKHLLLDTCVIIPNSIEIANSA